MSTARSWNGAWDDAVLITMQVPGHCPGPRETERSRTDLEAADGIIPGEKQLINRNDGRAGKTGINVVIGDEWEMNRYAALEKKLGLTVYPKEIRSAKVIAPLME